MVNALSLQVDNNYDLMVVSNGQGGLTLATITGRNEVEQALRIRLLTSLGEDEYSITCGLPIRAMIANGTSTYAAGAIASTMLADKRVGKATVQTVGSDPLTRRLQVEAEATLTDGVVIQINQVVG